MELSQFNSEEVQSKDDSASEEMPERNLVASIVAQAIDDFLLNRVTIKREFKSSARQWIFSYREQPYSFRWCCLALDLDFKIMWQMIRDGKVGPCRAK